MTLRKGIQFRRGGQGSMKSSLRKDLRPEGRIRITQSEWPKEGERKVRQVEGIAWERL